MRIWLSKPFYESLPYIYLVAGVSLLIASLYLDYWYWPTVCLVSGIICLILGLFVFLRRRDFRGDGQNKPSEAP
jgi:hypothetical protein